MKPSNIIAHSLSLLLLYYATSEAKEALLKWGCQMLKEGCGT